MTIPQGEDVVVDAEVVEVRDEPKGTLTATPLRPRLRERPWQDNPRVRENVSKVIDLMVAGLEHRPVELRTRLNRYLGETGQRPVSVATVKRYVRHVHELWADATTVSLGELNALIDDLHDRNLAVWENPLADPVEHTAAQRELTQLAIAKIRLHGFDQRSGVNVAVQINQDQRVAYPPEAADAARKADLILEALGDG